MRFAFGFGKRNSKIRTVNDMLLFVSVRFAISFGKFARKITVLNVEQKVLGTPRKFYHIARGFRNSGLFVFCMFFFRRRCRFFQRPSLVVLFFTVMAGTLYNV